MAKGGGVTVEAAPLRPRAAPRGSAHAHRSPLRQLGRARTH